MSNIAKAVLSAVISIIGLGVFAVFITVVYDEGFMEEFQYVIGIISLLMQSLCLLVTGIALMFHYLGKEEQKWIK